MEKKYKLIPSDVKGLYRVKALRDFGNVKKGEVGGYVQSEKNLSQEGDCWIYDNAKVYDNAYVCGNAKAYDNAVVRGNAEVGGTTWVYGNAEVYGNAKVYGDVWVYDNAKVYGNACVYGCAKVCDNAKVCGFADVCGEAIICCDAVVKSSPDYLVFKNFWSSGRYFTWTRSNNKWKVGCFYGSGEELIKKAYEESELSGKYYETFVNLVKSLAELK